jgi:hypothetical protein
LTFVPLDDSTFSFAKRGTGNDIEYSIDGGAWTSLASEANTPTVGAGHNIRWRAELTPITSGANTSVSTRAVNGIGTFSSSGIFKAYGNPYCLLYTNFIDSAAKNWCFCQLFRESGIIDASKIALPAMTLSYFCYGDMFYRCTSLTLAPALPALSLAKYCYSSIFYGCTNLVEIPKLPATTLADGCYSSMFSNTNITKAPELMANILVNYCYSQMFRYCRHLTTIKMLATDISASGCLMLWSQDVSSIGTFVKNAATTTLPTGASGIPSGWTVVDDQSTINS